MRWPVEQEKTRAGDDLSFLFRQPPNVAALNDGIGHPRLVSLSHQTEHLIVAASGINKHAAAMMGDERSVRSDRQPGFQHEEQYKT